MKNLISFLTGLLFTSTGLMASGININIASSVAQNISANWTTNTKSKNLNGYLINNSVGFTVQLSVRDTYTLAEVKHSDYNKKSHDTFIRKRKIYLNKYSPQKRKNLKVKWTEFKKETDWDSLSDQQKAQIRKKMIQKRRAIKTRKVYKKQ